MKEIIFFSDEIKKVLKGTSLSILKEYFDGRKLFLDLDFAKAEKKVSEFTTILFEKIQKLEPEKLRKSIELDLHQIYTMRDGKFLLPVIRELKLANDEIIEFIEDSAKTYDQTFILFLKDEDCFRNNYLAYGDGKVHKNWWNIRTDYVEKDCDISDKLAQELLAEVKRHLLGEGMGKYYVCNKKSFGNKEQIVIFYQNLPEEKLELQNKTIDIKVARPISKIVFLYDKKRRFVKTFSEDEEIRIAAHRAFAKIIFGKEKISKDQPKNKVCRLDTALEKLVNIGSINFTIPPSFNITKIYAVAATFSMVGGDCIMNICSKRKNKRYTNLKDNMGKFLKIDESSANKIAVSDIIMSKIEFTIEYRDYCSKKTYLTKRVAMTDKNAISNISEEDVDFEILDCLREAQILEIGGIS